VATLVALNAVAKDDAVTGGIYLQTSGGGGDERKRQRRQSNAERLFRPETLPELREGSTAAIKTLQSKAKGADFQVRSMTLEL
jgi:hypothetical protein